MLLLVVIWHKLPSASFVSPRPSDSLMAIQASCWCRQSVRRRKSKMLSPVLPVSVEVQSVSLVHIPKQVASDLIPLVLLLDYFPTAVSQLPLDSQFLQSSSAVLISLLSFCDVSPIVVLDVVSSVLVLLSNELAVPVVLRTCRHCLDVGPRASIGRERREPFKVSEVRAHLSEDLPSEVAHPIHH